jgi:hypothetical protein
MHDRFRWIVDALHGKYEILLAMPPVAATGGR